MTTMIEPSTGDKRIDELVERARARFDTGATRPIAWRLAQLDALTALLT